MSKIPNPIIKSEGTHLYFEKMHFMLKHCINTEFPISKYFTEKNLTVYLRAGPNFVQGKRVQAVTIARVYDEFMQASESGYLINSVGNGEYKKFILWLEQIAKEIGYAVIKIEQVQSPRLRYMSLKHGYTQLADSLNLVKYLG